MLEENDESASDGSLSVGISKLALACPLNTVFFKNRVFLVKVQCASNTVLPYDFGRVKSSRHLMCW